MWDADTTSMLQQVGLEGHGAVNSALVCCTRGESLPLLNFVGVYRPAPKSFGGTVYTSKLSSSNTRSGFSSLEAHFGCYRDAGCSAYFSSHSFHIGAVLAASAAGMSISAIQSVGHWQSQAFGACIISGELFCPLEGHGKGKY